MHPCWGFLEWPWPGLDGPYREACGWFTWFHVPSPSHQVNLNTIKRCLLINYNPDSQELDFRH